MNIKLKTLEQMNEKAEELNSDIEELKAKIGSLEKDKEKRIALADECSQKVVEVDDRVPPSQLRNLLENEDGAKGQVIAINSVLDRNKYRLNDLTRELGELNRVLHAEKNFIDAQKKLNISWESLQKSKACYETVESRLEAAVKGLEAAKEKQEQSLDKAILDEIETGKQSGTTQKKNRQLLDEIDIKKRTVELLQDALPKKNEEYRAAKDEYQGARVVFFAAQKDLMERSYLIALEGVIPVACKFLAASKLTGAAYRSCFELGLKLDKELVDEQLSSLDSCPSP